MDANNSNKKHKIKINSQLSEIKDKMNDIIFGVDTTGGKAFDVFLIWLISLSILTVLLESVTSFRAQYGLIFKKLEWIFTILFTFEYFLRILSTKNAHKYIFSFLGLIDFLSTLPTYLALYLANIHSLLILRIIRLLRIFRIFKLTRFIGELEFLINTFRKSKPKIIVFLLSILSLVLIMGTIMYLIEGEENGFTSIPRSIYWAIVTLTTVGYGDITPTTVLGQLISSIIMILGYSIIAVPTGIISVEYTHSLQHSKKCIKCKRNDLNSDSSYCRFCGEKLKNL